jgi:hypothetical protein
VGLVNDHANRPAGASSLWRNTNGNFCSVVMMMRAAEPDRASASWAESINAVMLSGWDDQERQTLIAGLVALPDEVHVLPLRDLAWPMGMLVA